MSEEARFIVRKAPEWRIPSWGILAYLIINYLDKRQEELVQVRPDERFDKVVTGHLRAYVEKGEMPPEDIAPAILNLADDFMAGREITIRAGDYIAIQNHLRRG